jgi:hypothetical protein
MANKKLRHLQEGYVPPKSPAEKALKEIAPARPAQQAPCQPNSGAKSAGANKENGKGQSNKRKK